MGYCFNHIGMPVYDLDKSIDWYSHYFGFKKIGNRSKKEELKITTAKIQLGNLVLELIEPEVPHVRPSLEQKIPLEKELSEIGIPHFALEVENPLASYTTLKNSGVDISEVLVSGVFFCYDPNGYRIEIRQKN